MFLQRTRACLDIVSPPCSLQYLLAQILRYNVHANSVITNSITVSRGNGESKIFALLHFTPGQ